METNYTCMLRVQEVCRRTGLSKSQVLRLVNDRSFPRPIRLSKRVVAWVAGDVETWLQERIGAAQQAA